ncbi:BnaAnng40670D [Brassica napus]|uniref:BnaAnng40670D protein n=1 Tax=Brassica napus TaxID=3708 RepID=A0A078K3I8_BRANA|nr:BnaAnng40670D [Brassica napus]
MVVAVDANEKKSGSSLKFLCSYGGKILPRSTDGKLRYVGGHTRVLSVDPSISFEELTKKLFEFCGYSVDLRCQLPNGDLETLISVKSDEELTNIVELHNRVSGAKIKAVLTPPRSHKSPSCSSGGGGDRSPNSPFSVTPCLQSRYCLPPTDLARRFHQRSGESYCYACRVHKGSRLIWH